MHARDRGRHATTGSLLAVLLTALLMAGCTSAPTSTLTSGPSTTSAETVEPSGMPPWSPGESWVHHWYFGANDTQGFLVHAIVTGRGSLEGAMRVATDVNATAALHGAFIFPTLGLFGDVRDFAARPGSVLVAKEGHNIWPWYKFPLRDGDSWSSPLVTLDQAGVSHSLQVHANTTYDPQATDPRLVATDLSPPPPLAMKRGAYVLELRADNGGLVARYDYSNETHWFTFADFYDYRDPVTEPTTPIFRIVTEEHAVGWNGTWYEASATLLVNKAGQVTPPNVTTPEPTYTFTPGSNDNHILAFPYSFAVGGAWATELIAPDGRHYELPSYAGPEGGGAGAALYVPTGTPGDWRVVSQGAGAFAAGGGIQAFGIDERAHQGLFG